MGQLVFIENHRPVTDSLLVAETFGKAHAKILRDIRELDCSPEFNQSNFGLVSYIDAGGRTYPKYLITQDGFVFLAMGFTGKEAARFKERYINEFNHMREQLSNPQLSEIEILQRSVGLLAEQNKRIEELEERMAQLGRGSSVQIEAPTQIAPPSETAKQKSASWRHRVNRLFFEIAKKRGGSYSTHKLESYQLLEQQVNCDLSIRLGKLREKLRKKGNGKLDGRSLSKMDVIDADDRLRELYVSIVEGMLNEVTGRKERNA